MNDAFSAVARLSALVDLDDPAAGTLLQRCHSATEVSKGSTIDIDREHASPILLVSGWAARTRISIDGKRQFLNLALPGDVIRTVDHGASPLMALTDVKVCPAPSPQGFPTLAEAYRRSRQLDESYLLAQIGRLGSMGAEERLIDLMAELYERLILAGLVDAGIFAVPLSQAEVADLLALTSAHTNRVVQKVRRMGELDWNKGRVAIRAGSTIDLTARRNISSIGRYNGYINRQR